jgi:hypothetical protein
VGRAAAVAAAATAARGAGWRSMRFARFVSRSPVGAVFAGLGRRALGRGRVLGVGRRVRRGVLAGGVLRARRRGVGGGGLGSGVVVGGLGLRG